VNPLASGSSTSQGALALAPAAKPAPRGLYERVFPKRAAQKATRDLDRQQTELREAIRKVYAGKRTIEDLARELRLTKAQLSDGTYQRERKDRGFSPDYKTREETVNELLGIIHWEISQMRDSKLFTEDALAGYERASVVALAFQGEVVARYKRLTGDASREHTEDKFKAVINSVRPTIQRADKELKAANEAALAVEAKHLVPLIGRLNIDPAKAKGQIDLLIRQIKTLSRHVPFDWQPKDEQHILEGVLPLEWELIAVLNKRNEYRNLETLRSYLMEEVNRRAWPEEILSAPQ
jgi:hypothetical protein